jgi:6-phosphofructokinase 1
MNACIRSIVKYCLNTNITPVGFYDGYQGMIENRFIELNYSDVNNIIQLGGTILGTARSESFRTKEGRRLAIENLKSNRIDALICIGGDGTFAGAKILSDEMDIPVVGIPGTIDNDISGTDHSIGYDTALNTVIDAIDKIRDTASSHHRIFFVEVMGRNAGFIALNSALASGAESVLIPEELTDIESLANDLKEQNKGKRGSIVIVAEGDDAGGALEIMRKVEPLMEGYSFRSSILGHIQRGGSPSAFDRLLATRMGVFAVDQLLLGKSKIVIGAKGDELIISSIDEAVKIHAIPNLSKLKLLSKVRTNGNS